MTADLAHYVVQDRPLAKPPRDYLAVPTRRYSVERTFAVPGFWSGAAEGRRQTGDTGRGLLLCLAIEKELQAGTPLREIAQFHEWLGPRAEGAPR